MRAIEWRSGLGGWRCRERELDLWVFLICGGLWGMASYHRN